MITDLQKQFIDAVVRKDWRKAEKLTFRIDHEIRKAEKNKGKQLLRRQEEMQ